MSRSSIAFKKPIFWLVLLLTLMNYALIEYNLSLKYFAHTEIAKEDTEIVISNICLSQLEKFRGWVFVYREADYDGNWVLVIHNCEYMEKCRYTSTGLRAVVDPNKLKLLELVRISEPKPSTINSNCPDYSQATMDSLKTLSILFTQLRFISSINYCEPEYFKISLKSSGYNNSFAYLVDTSASIPEEYQPIPTLPNWYELPY